ncbi:MAG: aspartate-semialdehyde dehydrogenase [Canidatus Methanoxibalbensis ujae]|nr:aspartate-semialdehyde dehydrogenase [Candidatus Methanoxibalbensis ujae]MCW7078748.1 aspartate-semialdehyde dehydrogenase [Candidatus Methanoxibalbensis ujae]
MRKIKAGVLGATGSVGQRFVQLLSSHPWFEIAAVFASERSAGREYSEVAKWFLPTEMPGEVAEMTVKSLRELDDADVDIMFSALPRAVAADVEKRCAELGYAVSSNVAVHRLEEDVPLVIPEVNASHLALIGHQKKRRGWDGFIVTNPNCSTIILTISLKPLMEFRIEEVHVATMQAVSGAGYAGVTSMAILDNIIPFIAKEEEKMEREPLKILGTLEGDRIVDASFKISASCHRVPVIDGHTEAVWVRFAETVTAEDVKSAFESFKSELKTPFSPKNPIIVREEEDRPQPRLDRDAEKGMSISVGRIRESKGEGSEIKYIVLGHNTIRGAAGASILNAELLVELGYL